MPIYEFQCRDCGKRTSVFFKTASSALNPACPSCKSANLERVMSRFGIRKTVKSVHEEYGSPGANTGMDYYQDPRNIGRGVEEKFAQMGAEMPSSIRGMIDAAREGDLPESVKDLQPNVGEI